MGRLLRENRAYARLWLAQAVSLVGDWFTLIALSVLVSRDTRGSGLAVSGLLLMQLLPTVLIGPFSGVLADRFDRRRLLITTDLLRCGLVLLFIPAVGSGHLGLMYVLAFLHFTVSTVFEPARSALMPNIVEPAELVAASTLGSVTWSVMAAVGGVLGGSVLSAAGITDAFLVDAFTFAASAGLIVSIGPAERRGRDPATHAAGPGFLDGLRHVAAHPVTGAALLIKAINGLALVDTFMVIYATRLFVAGEGGAGALGLLYASFGVGAVLGPLLLNAVNDGSVRRMRRLIVAGSALISSGLFVLAGAPTLAVTALAIVLRGMGGSTNWTYSTIILQKTVPDRLRGRLFSIDLANATLAAAGAAVVWGFLIDRAGVRVAVLVAASLSLAPLAAWTASLRWMERREAATEA